MAELPGTEQVQHWLAQEDRASVEQLCDEVHPYELAQLVEPLDDVELWHFLRLAPDAAAGEVFSHLDLDRQATLAEQFESREVAQLLEQVASDDRTDVIQALPEDQQQQILALMAGPQREATERLTQYPEGTVGAVTNTDVVTLRADDTAAAAIDRLRQSAEYNEAAYYNYILDDQQRLVGIVSLRALIRARPNTPLREVMDTDMVVLRADEPRTEAARKIQEYDLLALPVVNGESRFLGIVTVDDVMDVVEAEVTEDFHKLGGVAALDQPYLSTTVLTLVRKRVGWLAILFIAGLFTVAAMERFEEHIGLLPLLAVFVPLIIATGGNSGFQAATVMTRAMALREVAPEHFWRVLGRELLGGLLLGLILAAFGFILATLVGLWIYRGDPQALPYAIHVGIAVSMSIVAVVLFGNLVGSMLPFILIKLGFDPATGSTPFVATVVDVMGLLIYFSIATWWLGDLMAAAAQANGS